MSSLAAARADNFYHPPDWDPSKEGRNKYQKSKGSNQYEQKGLIRFEMPFDVWCTNCAKATKEEVQAGTAYSHGHENHIGRGVRFDAYKEQDGKYFSTKVWKFTMKCHLCYHEMVIRTDPKNCDYELVKGLRRKVKEYKAEDVGVEELNEKKTKEQLEDPFYRLEHQSEDKRKATARAKGTEGLLELQSRKYDDYDANSSLRKKMRAKKKEDKKSQQEAKAKGLTGVTLLPLNPDDSKQASEVKFSRKCGFRESKLVRRLAVRSASIFDAPQSKRRKGQIVEKCETGGQYGDTSMRDYCRERTLQTLAKARSIGISSNEFRIDNRAASPRVQNHPVIIRTKQKQLKKRKAEGRNSTAEGGKTRRRATEAHSGALAALQGAYDSPSEDDDR
jgi:coiled-coil domain-containing protein 130